MRASDVASGLVTTVLAFSLVSVVLPAPEPATTVRAAQLTPIVLAATPVVADVVAAMDAAPTAVVPAEAPPAPPAPTAPAAPAASEVVRDWEGVASWYGPGFAGRRTASGERFDPSAYTAAHKTLPFGSLVRVTSLRTGRSITVRINDRGPFTAGREIDLSRAAAEAIGVKRRGVGGVRLELLAA